MKKHLERVCECGGLMIVEEDIAVCHGRCGIIIVRQVEGKPTRTKKK